jgi:hypothetical protein
MMHLLLSCIIGPVCCCCCCCRLDIEPKLTNYAEAAGLQLPLFHADVSALKAKLLAMPPAMWSKVGPKKSMSYYAW